MQKDNFENRAHNTYKAQRQRLTEHLKDKKNRMVIATRVKLLFAFVATLFYAGSRFLLELEILREPETYANVFFMVLIVSILVDDAAKNADYDEEKNNQDFVKFNKQYKEELDGIDNQLDFSKKLREYNKMLYQQACNEHREEKIKELEEKATKAINRNKKRKEKALTQKIERLKAKDNEGNYIEKVKPKKRFFVFDDFNKLNKEDFLSTSFSKKKDNTSNAVRYQSESVQKKRSIKFIIFRSILLVALNATIAGTTDSWGEFFRLITLILFSGVMSYIATYELIRKDKEENEIHKRWEKLQILKDIKNIKIEK